MVPGYDPMTMHVQENTYTVIFETDKLSLIKQSTETSNIREI